MKYDEELRLMALLIQMGFGREYIIWTLFNCDNGQMIGEAMSNAIGQCVSGKMPCDKNEQ